MKKAMKAALCILSAITMASAGAMQAAAGTLSKEELIEKYAPNGAYDVSAIHLAPWTAPTYYGSNNTELDVDGYVQTLMDAVDRDSMTHEELHQYNIEISEKVAGFFSSQVEKVMYAYNAYRTGCNGKQFFKNCSYEAGFYYVLREDGTASIVGADDTYFAEKTVMEIPETIGGTTVTKIENRAFEHISQYLPNLSEIVLPDTVEVICEGAFVRAMTAQNCSINLPKNLKYIGRFAFYETAQCLGDEFYVIQIPESVEYIGNRAFYVYGVDERGMTPDNLLYYQMGFKSNTPTCFFEMPESLVMFEENNIDRDAVLTAMGCGRSETLKQYTYADINARNPEEISAIKTAYEEASANMHIKTSDALLNADLPLNALDIQLIEEDLKTFSYLYCTKGDMCRTGNAGRTTGSSCAAGFDA